LQKAVASARTQHPLLAGLVVRVVPPQTALARQNMQVATAAAERVISHLLSCRSFTAVEEVQEGTQARAVVAAMV
jgi:hypothetical protein